jgi:sterol desaturase/sphingolipid hydroxylase (fatty acid hydroxylase superfamily)
MKLTKWHLPVHPAAVLAAFLCVGVYCAGAAAQVMTDAVPQSMVDRMYGPYAPLIRQISPVLLQLGIITMIALPFQAFFPGVRRKPKIQSYEYWLDVMYWCQGIWLSLVSFWVITEWIVGALYGTTSRWIPALTELPVLLQVVVAIWAYDFAVYWRHRFEHTFTVLWSFHAVHHTAEKVDVLTTSRLHPFELLFGGVINTAVMRAGLHPAAAALGFSLYLYYNYFIHTNVRIRFPGFLRYLFVSPFMHQWHHASDEAAAGKNVGVVFAWNDWIFGTAYHPDHWPTNFGLSGPPAERVGQSYFRHLLYPLQLFIARAMAWRAARVHRPESA